MVNVSENFKTLAMQNGREISCKIFAGNEIFLDDRLIEFDFDDVIHPNWYTLGSTCSNRFAFSVRYSGELEVHDEVRPYISFDGVEWCPLGVFYVARRYVRGNYASIICYDKMYSLEMEYVPDIYEPYTTNKVLDDICSRYGIVRDTSNIANYNLKTIPVGATVRDMLGYIAGYAFGNAKFNREGKFVIRSYSQMDNFRLMGENCIDYSRNMSPTKYSRIVCDTGNGIIEVGSGGEISTLELYNPLLTEGRATFFLVYFSMMGMYGADIEFQGLPFLESGDHIYLCENVEGKVKLYPIAVSEIEFHYNGGLTARLYSRTRSYTDAAVHQDDLSEALEQIRASLGNICEKRQNTEDFDIPSEEIQAANFSFDTRVSGLFAQVDLNCTIEGAGKVVISGVVNGQTVRESVHETEGESELVHFYFLAENLPKGNNNVVITLKTESGALSVKSGGLVATLVCRGAAGGEEKPEIRDRLIFSDKVQKIGLGLGSLDLKPLNDSIALEITNQDEEA